MRRFLLPAFRGDGGEPAPQGKRGWETFPMSDLSRFSKALAAPEDLAANLFIDAIPDVWAKALLFGYALSDESHTLHRRAVGSFRGFLTMLALRHTHKYDITALRVELSPGSLKPFEAALGRLLPTAKGEMAGSAHLLSNSVGWSPAYVFLLGRDAIGICSPLTMVAPHEGPDMKTAAARGLTDGFRFTDPSNKLGPVDAAMVHEWLSDLQAHIVANAQDGLWRGAVTSQILAFQLELKKKAGDILPAIQYENGDLFEIKTAFFRPLGRALARPTGDLVESNFELRRRTGVNERVLLIDESMINHLSPDTEIITGISASLLKDQPLGRDSTHIGHYELPAGWLWIRPNDFLLQQLTVIQTRDAFISVAKIAVHQAKASDPYPLPPLKETVSEYISADYVSRNSWFERTNNGFTFRLKLPTSGNNVEAARSYSFSDLKQIALINMPVAEIWPATRLDGWKRYYTFWSRDSESTKFYISPSGVEVFKKKAGIERSTREEVTVTAEAPLYLACFELVDGHDGVEKQPLGLLIPSFQETPPNSTLRTFTLGFDFGTTNTNIFVSKGSGDDPCPLTILPSTVQIVNNEPLAREGLMYRRFLPAQKDEAPFLSLLRRRTNLAGGFEVIRDAHVLFYHQQVESAQFDDDDIVSYLKWTTAQLNDDRIAFLRQMVLHAAYEARLQGASKLRFMYSYPTSFDESTHEMLQAFWNMVPEMSELIGVPCELAGSQTESIATATYFERSLSGGRGALLSTGAMVLDIGGGTTDISVWLKRKLEIQTSVRLSGREILLSPMEENKEYVIKMLADCMANGSDIFKPLESLEKERFYRRADAILRAHGDDLLERLMSLMTTESFERFRSEIALRLTALVYYAGLLLRRKKWLESNPRLPDLYIGGNGSRVFNWLAPPRFQDNHTIVDLLLTAYASGAGSDHPPPEELKIYLSEHPKSEVACGLVYDVEHAPANQDEAIETVGGEIFQQGSEAHSETEPLTISLLQKGVRVTQAREIKRLLEVYNDFTDRQGAILLPVTNSRQVVQRAVDEINDWAHQQTLKDMRSISIAPLFVVGVVEAFSLVEWKAPATHAASA